MSALNNLQRRNNILKSKLLHDKLKYGTFQFNTFKKDLLLVLNSYKTHKSLIKAADIVGVDKNLVIDWFVEGQLGNPQFRGFYLVISQIGRFEPKTIFSNVKEVVSPEVDEDWIGGFEEVVSPEVDEVVKKYTISEYLNSCVYTAEIDDEKISIISRDLDTLKQVVKSKNLPID